MTRRKWTVAIALTSLLLGACGDDDDDGGGDAGTTTTTEATTTTAEAEPLVIVVTNDDGYAAPGIDALVEALRAEPDVEVSVVAPAEDRTGTGPSTTPGELVTRDVTTASGYEAVAVEGFPADTVRAAIDQLGIEPDLVVSGINMGQNLGPLTDVSGTVGAARAAASRGLPALAVSQGLGDPIDYESGVEQAIAWLRENRDDLAEGTVANLNVPTCPAGELRGLVEVPVAEDLTGRDAFAVDCTSTAPAGADDVAAFVVGYATLSPDAGLD